MENKKGCHEKIEDVVDREHLHKLKDINSNIIQVQAKDDVGHTSLISRFLRYLNDFVLFCFFFVVQVCIR